MPLPHLNLPHLHLPLPLIADGSIRTHLERAHPGHPFPVEELSLSRPEQVQAAHETFAAAGAVLHRTNTRGAHRVALLPHGLEERSEAINNSGAALLRAAIGAEGLMMGTIGETVLDPSGAPAPVPERERGYAEQVVYLADTGVTFLLLEHFTLVDEALRVIRIARSASDVPVLAQLRFDPSGTTADGLDCREAARRLAAGGADALGISCGPRPEAWPRILEALSATGLPVSVMAGIREGAHPEPYPGAPELSPHAFAEALAPLAEQGVAMLGGCCGAGPVHIRALAERLAGGGQEPE
jgi:homocysteine S-methyltransferase